MAGYDFYRIYKPLHLHFTTEYDAIKYGCKSKHVSYDTYKNRTDKLLFEQWDAHRWFDKQEAGKFCLANFIYNREDWLYQDKQNALEAWKHWTKIRQSINQVFKNDLNVLSEAMENEKRPLSSWEEFIEKTPSGNRPPLMQLAQSDKISRETLCALDGCNEFIHRWSDMYANDPLISDWCFLTMKYKPFCITLVSNPKTQLEGMFSHHGK